MIKDPKNHKASKADRDFRFRPAGSKHRSGPSFKLSNLSKIEVMKFKKKYEDVWNLVANKEGQSLAELELKFSVERQEIQRKKKLNKAKLKDSIYMAEIDSFNEELQSL